MREKQNNWQRIEAVIKWANMSTNYFARYIGLARGENLYQIKRGNNGISLDVADRIVSKFPQVDKLWLLTGEGQMLYQYVRNALGLLATGEDKLSQAQQLWMSNRASHIWSISTPRATSSCLRWGRATWRCAIRGVRWETSCRPERSCC